MCLQVHLISLWFLPGTQLSGAHTALLALILWAYLMISSEEMFPVETEKFTEEAGLRKQHRCLTFSGFVNRFQLLFGLIDRRGLKTRHR